MKLSLIIVTYNSYKYIQKCIQSILDSIEPFDDYEIIIIDNNSKDGTIDIVNNFSNSKIKILKSNDNMGYSAAVNKAIEVTSFEKVLVLNPDTIILENGIVELFERSNRSDVGVVGAKLLNLDGTLQVSSRRHFPTLGILFSYVLRLNKIFNKSRFFGKYNYTHLDENLETSVDSVSGACMMFSKNLFDSVNGFDEVFFIYFEDTDFCLKVKDAGLKVLYCPSAKIVHCNDYSDNGHAKIFYFYESFEKFIYKYKHKICLGILVYYFAKLINNIFQLKRRFIPAR